MTPCDIVIVDLRVAGANAAAVRSLRSARATAAASFIAIDFLSEVDNVVPDPRSKVDAVLYRPISSAEFRRQFTELAARNAAAPDLRSHVSALLHDAEIVTANDDDRGLRASEPLRPRVLVVEDNATNQLVVGAFLSKLGYEHMFAKDGAEGVEMNGWFAPDVILMDISMPVMNGLEATTAIRQRELAGATSTIIIGLTANALAGDKEKCIAAGMDGYLSKPVRMAQLEEEIQRCLSRGDAASKKAG